MRRLGIFFEPFSALNLTWFRVRPWTPCGSGSLREPLEVHVQIIFRVEEASMKLFISVILCLVLFLLTPIPLFSEENEVTLEEVVVTATRDIQEIRKIPANVTVITRKEIERSHVQTIVDLLRNEVGVMVRDLLGTGKNVSVDIRGYGETSPLNTLVLVDGRRVNEIDLSGVDWAQIPLDQVERIEILRGPGSVLYGDNAVGGVINIITKKPEKPFSAGAEGVIGSYHYNKESGSISGKWGPFSAILDAGYTGTEGYRDNGFLRAKDVGGKVLYDLNENISLNFSGGFHQDDTGLPGGLTAAEIDQLGRQATVRPGDKAETEDWYSSLGGKAKFGNLGRLEVDLSYRHREVEDFFRSFSFEDRRNSNTWRVTPRYVLEAPLGTFQNKLTAGFDFYDSESTVFSESAFGSNRLEVQKISKGGYLLDEFSILSTLILSLGYRMEWVTFDLFQDVPRARDDTRDRDSAWNVGLDYLFGKRSSAFLSVKRSFRFPVSDELIQFFPVFQVNPAITPQRGYHYEAGIRHFFTDQIEGSLTLFWIETKNEIFFNPDTFTNENYPKTRRQGIEAGAKIRPLPWLLVWANYGYMRPTLRGGPFSGNDIPAVPRHKGSIGGEIDIGKGFLFTTNANIAGSSRLISDFANQFGQLGGYWTVDVRLSYTWKGLKAFAGINNLLDRKYSEYGAVNSLGTQSFFPSPTRNFIGGISYTF
jgi:iron complex outermembrane receptor protein